MFSDFLLDFTTYFLIIQLRSKSSQLYPGVYLYNTYLMIIFNKRALTMSIAISENLDFFH